MLYGAQAGERTRTAGGTNVKSDKCGFQRKSLKKMYTDHNVHILNNSFASLCFVYYNFLGIEYAYSRPATSMANPSEEQKVIFIFSG
jgi:hypothetical protein